MNKLLIICGPTATGKTSLSLKLAQKFKAEIISADSRQVYIGMDIGTGKDIPKGYQLQTTPYRLNGNPISIYSNGTKIWGYDLVKPTQEFSASHFYIFAWKVIKLLWQQKKLPIIVGGTGLYLKTLLQPPQSLGIIPNPKLRQSLEKLSVKKLQQRLSKLDASRFKALNHSDRNNPRRLIRAIETRCQLKPSSSITQYKDKADVLWVGLTAPLVKLDQLINQRVLKRINNNFSQEVKQLRSTVKDKSLPASTALGYQQWLLFLKGKITQAEAISKWQIAERQYARRQLTWFKKQSSINWFNICQPNYKAQVVKLVKSWYAKT